MSCRGGATRVFGSCRAQIWWTERHQNSRAASPNSKSPVLNIWVLEPLFFNVVNDENLESRAALLFDLLCRTIADEVARLDRTIRKSSDPEESLTDHNAEAQKLYGNEGLFAIGVY